MASGAAIGVLAVGTGLSLYGEYKQAQAQADAVRAQADAKRAQAFEILGRAEVNIERLRREAEVFKARQTGAVVRGGAEIRGQTLIQLEQTNSDVLEAIADQRREADFKAEQLFRGADIDTRLAGDIGAASRLSLLGGTLGGAGRVGIAASRLNTARGS